MVFVHSYIKQAEGKHLPPNQCPACHGLPSHGFHADEGRTRGTTRADGLCMASHEEDLQQFGKKTRKPSSTSSTSAGNIKSKLLNWNLWDNIWLPRTGPSSFRPHWLLKTLGCREFDSTLLEKPVDMSFDGEWKVMYGDIDKNDLTIDRNVWKFSSWEVFIPPCVYQCRNFETWSCDQKPAMQIEIQ